MQQMHKWQVICQCPHTFENKIGTRAQGCRSGRLRGRLRILDRVPTVARILVRIIYKVLENLYQRIVSPLAAAAAEGGRTLRPWAASS
jgi:hypothetical protein